MAKEEITQEEAVEPKVEETVAEQPLQEQVPAQDPVKTRLKSYVSVLYEVSASASLPKKTHDGLYAAAVELTKFIENSPTDERGDA